MSTEDAQINMIISRKGKQTGVKIWVRDGKSIAQFSDKVIGKEIALAEIKHNRRVNWDDATGLMFETFPRKSQSEILKIITKQLQQSGGTQAK